MSHSLAAIITSKILQQAINKLFTNRITSRKVNFLETWQVERSVNEERIELAIKKAKNLLNYPDNAKIQALKVLFDHVELSRQPKQPHYWTPQALINKQPLIPYPQEEKPSSEEITNYLQQSCEEINALLKHEENRQNLALLSLIIEKYGSFISLGEEDIALVDLVRSTAAVAAVLAENPEATQVSLIVGDLSGVQKFIYTISSAGALKSLRARSFYLELVTEEIVQQLLKELALPRTNVIFAGASKLYILAAATEKTNQIVKNIGNKFNNWLRTEFQGKVFLALDNYDFPLENINVLNQKFAQQWSKANKNLDKQRSQKFKDQINNLLQPHDAHEPCKICHRDDVRELEKLGDDSDIDACGTCCRLYRLGGQLKDVKAIVRSQDKQLSRKYLHFKLSPQRTYYYHLFDDIEEANKQANKDKLFLVNNWNLNDYSGLDVTPLLIGNYSQKSSDNPKAFITAEELAAVSQGIKRVGYLRMDVDNLGQIFARGLEEEEKQTLPQIAGLSRQMTYFFKVYLNSLAENRHVNIPQDDNYQQVELSNNSKRDNLLFIYAGGDDLFIAGAWNELVEFGFDVYQSFRAYSGYNPDITISAGISLAVPKFPLYQAADESGDAEETAKGNGKDSLTLFGQTFKWDEWLGNKDNIQLSIKQKTQTGNLTKKEQEIINYLKTETYPELFGVFPFVEQLEQQQIGTDYARNFVGNLLKTAQLQEQKLEDIKQKRRERLYSLEDKDIKCYLDIKYYLHLPLIAYTLARLEKNVDLKEDFRKSLKNPRNAIYFRAIATWIELLNR